MPPRKAKNEKKIETCDSAWFSQNSSTTESKSTHNDHWTEINKSQIHVDLEEKLNESALENNDISMLSSSSTFASDLIDACANASAEMLDLHLTPYDLKSVHEYQISNHKKLTEVIQLLKCLLEENSRLRLTIDEIQDKISKGIQQTGEGISQQPPMSSLFKKTTEPVSFEQNYEKYCHEAGHSNNPHPINSTTQSDSNYLDFPTLQQAHSSTLKPNADH